VTAENLDWALDLGRRIDYVFVRIFDEPVDGVWASDHFGVVAGLTLPARSPGF
jgi:endonuclease/exonuclease/phosphatase family metal-dependent hydrolase